MKMVGAEPRRVSWRLALVVLALLASCGRSDGRYEDIGSHAEKVIEDPGPGPITPSPPSRPTALLGWPSTPVIASEPTGTLPGEGGVGVAGDYRYTLPIEVPPGRAGMAPSLSLSYSSSGENGIAGVGWSLTGLSAIKACNMTFATDGVAQEGAKSVYLGVGSSFKEYAQKTAWCLDGQRLVTTGEDDPYAAGPTHAFRTESDTFSRIESTQALREIGENDYVWAALSFKVFLRDGRIRSYAQDPELLTEFLLAKEEDRFGNTITYSYTPPGTGTAKVDPYQPAPLAIEEETARLATITYTGRASSGELGSRRILLKYEDRLDPIFVTDSIPVTSSKKRLQSIDCYAPVPGVGTSVGVPMLAWSYTLSYTASITSGRSLLTSVKRTGPQGSAQLAKEFTWQQAQGGVYTQPNFTLPQGDTAGNYVVIDVDHDGRDELLYSPPGLFSPHLLYSTVGSAQPLSHVTILPGLARATLTDASVGDIDGDGIPEIVAPDRTANASGIKFYEMYRWSSTLNDYVVATSSDRPWRSYIHPSSSSVEQPLFLVDMDGDGLPDMIQAQYVWSAYGKDNPSCALASAPDRPKCLFGYSWTYFHNTGGAFAPGQESSYEQLFGPAIVPRSGSPFSASVLTDRAGLSYFSGMQSYDIGSGSSRPVSVKIAPGGNAPALTGPEEYFPGCVYGDFTGRGNEPVCDALPYPWRTTVFDFDGDGRDELFEYLTLPGNAAFAVFVNKRIHFDDAGVRHEDLDPQTPLVTGDFNGDGLQDAILYDQTLGQTFAALNAGPTRDLMIAVQDEAAPKPLETVQYTQNWSADPVTAKPCAPHPERCLRQGMNVVVERDVYQGSSVDTYEHTFFNYSDPRIDVHGRGFLGFGTVRAWNPDRLSETITDYDNATSVDGAYFAFMPSRVSHYTAIAPVTGSPRHYTVRGSVVSSRYAVDRPIPSTYFRHPTTWDSVEWETDAAIDITVGVAKHFVFALPPPTPLRQRNGESSFDAYGNRTYSRSETVSGVKTEVTARYDNFPKEWRIGELTQTLTTVTEPGAGSPTPRQANYAYGSHGELTSSTIEEASADAAIKQTTSFGYNSDGLLIARTASQPALLSTLPPGAPLHAGDADRSVYVEYDPDEGIFPRKVWNDLGHVAQTLYHPAFGAISEAISANGVESEIVYDGLGRARKVTRGGESPVFLHQGPRKNSAGKFLGSYMDTSGAGVASTHAEYDEYDRLVLQSHVGFDGAGVFSQTKYDGLGRLQFSSRGGVGQPASTGTTYAYDGLDRVVSVTDPSGKSTVSAHTFFETHTTDAVTHESYAVRDINGRLVKSVDVGDGNVEAPVTFQYGNFNQIKSITDSKNNVSRVEYDQRGRRVSFYDPDSGTSTFHYNAFSDLTAVDVPGLHGSAAPEQTRYQRDELGRVVRIDNGDGITEFAWDTSPYGVGLLASQSNARVEQTFEYDWYGRPSSETWTVDGESFDLLTSYDFSGRVSTITYPEVPGRATRFKVQRSYSASNSYFTSVAEIDRATPLKLWEVLARNADDQLLVGQFGNSRLSKRVYEPSMGRLTSIKDMACTGVNCVGAEYSLGYTYLDDGNVETRTDYVTGRAEKFSYDVLNRLKSWDLTYNGSTHATGYAYDDIGNLKSVSVGGVVAESNTYHPSGSSICAVATGVPCPGPHALASSTAKGVTKNFDYDTRGRQVSALGRKVEFSEANLPASILTAAGSTVFAYDASGARVKKVGPSEETLSLGGLYERRSTPSGTQHVFFVSGGDGNMTQVTFMEGSQSSDRVEYVHTDALGTTGAVTDDTGSVTRFYHEPFGARIDASGAAFTGTLGDVRLGFTGQVSDDDLGLVNMKGRVYDPSQKHFISPDPLVSAPASAQSYNRYSYVRNNPLYFIDPSGFDEGPPPPPPPPDGGPTNPTGGPGKDANDGSSGHQASGGTRGSLAPGAPATPYKAAPAPGGSTGASSVHDANVHHDRMLALDLDRGNSRAFDKFVRAANAKEPGSGAANFGLIIADWLRTGVPPNAPELKVALNGAAGIVKQTAPLLQTTPAPAPPAPDPAPPVATTPAATSGGSSDTGSLLPRPTHANGHGFTIRDVNPTGNDYNCAECSIAVDDLLAGREPWTAPPADRDTPYEKLERAFGSSFSEPLELHEIISQIDEAGPGARGIVFGIPDPKISTRGHFFNVANQKDVVRLLDGQTGTATDTSRFERFRIIRTNP